MTITYLVDGYYNPADELGVAWDDPEIGADWGVAEPIALRPRPGEPAAAPTSSRSGSRTPGLRPVSPCSILVTGGAGFIGSNYVRYVLANTDDEVTVYDALTYAGNLATLRDVEDDPRYRFVKGDICDPGTLEEAMAGHDAVVHFAAETHVDRSIAGPDDFVRTNCFGTNVVMDAARRLGVGRVVHISTDEVYGSVERGFFAGDRPARAALAVLGVEGRLRPDRARRTTPPTGCRSRSPGAPTTSGRTSSPRRSSRSSPPTCSTASRAALRRRPQRARLALRRRPLRRRRPRAHRRAPPARSTTSARATRRRTGSSSTRSSGSSASVRRWSSTSRTALGHDRRYSVDIAKICRARLAEAAHSRRGARPDRGVVPRQPLVVGAAQAGEPMRSLPGACPRHRGGRAGRARARRRRSPATT